MYSKHEIHSLPLESGIQQAIQKVVNHIRYSLAQEELGDLMNQGLYWSLDKSKWKYISTKVYTVPHVKSPLKLDKKTAKAIQQYLNEGIEPFFALKHLQRAMQLCRMNFLYE